MSDGNGLHRERRAPLEPVRGQRVGVLDIGSNSIRLVVYDHAGRSPIPVFNEKALCGLVCIVAIYLSSDSPVVVLGFYTLTVVLFCGSYALIQLLIICRTRSCRGFVWLRLD